MRFLNHGSYFLNRGFQATNESSSKIENTIPAFNYYICKN